MNTVLVVRLPQIDAGPMLEELFASEILVWMVGGVLLGIGVSIVAFHQYWRSAAAIAISLFGWFLALRGLMMMAAPGLLQSGVSASMTVTPLVRAGFGLLVLLGLWLTWVGWRASGPEGRLERSAS